MTASHISQSNTHGVGKALTVAHTSGLSIRGVIMNVRAAF